MAINLKFDSIGNPEPPTIILSNRNGNKLGQLDVNVDSIDLSDKLVDASEFSFTINKYIDDELTNLWDKVVDFKLVYCKEWDMYFEIKVELDEATETVKTVFCTQLGQAELSQIMLYNIEINTEKDIERDDYKISILYDENDPKASILSRMLEKAPHYHIAYVDSTIAKIQRSFSFDGTSIHDGFNEIAEEIGCLFDYPSNLTESGKINRGIHVYDMQQNCNDCGHRGEFTDKCPKCGSTNIKYGYGEDTTIFVTADELASSGIQLVTDTDSVKNCFKLEAGDDLMTATVRNCNPNGTDYIWYFSNSLKEDMSDELVNRLESYDELYRYHYNDSTYNIDVSLLTKYNALIDKYSPYNEDLQKITTPIKGYSALMNAYYNTIDLGLYLKSGLMPSIEMSETNAAEQAALLTASALSPVAVTDITIASLATMNSAVLSMAKVIVKSTYKIEVNTSEIIEGTNSRSWKGNFVITNYSDEEDTAVSSVITVAITDEVNNQESFIKQKIDKMLNKEDTDDYSISGLFEMEHNNFCNELRKYALNPLTSFHDACQACIDILIEQGVGNGDTWSDDDEGSESNLYEKLYTPYYNKLKAIESEMKVREDEINIVVGVYDTNNNLIADGLQTNIEKCKSDIQKALDFEDYLGIDLWLEFSAYRRDDKYSNDNYISDGLNNAELFKIAQEFYETAENEIYKSAELQHSISTTLNNLLAIKKFESLVKYFKNGNWIRVLVDDRIYKLRLLEYGINFGDFNDISVEFSDIAKIKNGTTDVQNILSKASSMATSYSSVQRQASQGEKSNTVVNNWINNGLNMTNTKIVGADNQNQVWDKNGILCREYDSITEAYSPEQLKIVNSTIAITDNNWQSTKTAIGKIYYVDPKSGQLKSTYGVNAETIIGKLLIGEQLDISNENGNLQFGVDGFVVENDNNTVAINPNNKSIFNIKNNNENILSFNDSGGLVIVGDITASSLTLLDGTEIEGGKIAGLSNVAISGSYNDLEDVPTKLSDFANDNLFITKDVNNLSNYYNKSESYNKSETDELLNLKTNIEDLADVSVSGSYNDLIDVPSNISTFNNDVGYLTQDDLNVTLNDALDAALTEAKENGEFNGKDGASASHSWDGTILTITSASGTSSSDLKGEKGDDGISPEKGTDYWTEEDKAEIINAVLAELRSQGVIS